MTDQQHLLTIASETSVNPHTLLQELLAERAEVRRLLDTFPEVADDHPVLPWYEALVMATCDLDVRYGLG